MNRYPSFFFRLCLRLGYFSMSVYTDHDYPSHYHHLFRYATPWILWNRTCLFQQVQGPSLHCSHVGEIGNRRHEIVHYSKIFSLLVNSVRCRFNVPHDSDSFLRSLYQCFSIIDYHFANILGILFHIFSSI